jgi:phosphopantetheinyl transferase
LITWKPQRLGGTIDVWVAEVPTELDTSRHRLASCLGPDEVRRFERTRNRASRTEYAFAHLFLRWVLSASVDGSVSPNEWRFGKDDHGKPLASLETGAPGPRFSLTHTSWAAGVAVTRSMDVGIDMEPRRLPRGVGIVEDVLSPSERRRIRRTPAPRREEEFIRLWTRKEASAKLDGRGVASPCFAVDCRDRTARREAFATFEVPFREPCILTVAWNAAEAFRPRLRFRSTKGWPIHLANHLVTEGRVDERWARPA